MVRIKVPATTANLGPGFDCLGMALELFQTITIEKNESEKKVLWTDEKLVEDKDNYVIQAIEFVLEKFNHSTMGYSLVMEDTQIPVSRGLGSSAAALVAGLYAANYLLDYPLSQHDILNYANQLEGHPDNVAPAILGNVVLATTIDHQTIYSQIEFPQELELLVFVPNFKLSTDMARKALPDQYPREKVIFNISRMGFLVNSLITHNFQHLKMAFEDTIHQPYRYPLIEDSQLIINAIQQIDNLGYFISGAGPTLIALVRKGTVLNMKELINTCEFKHKWQYYSLPVNHSGTTIEVLK
ncbi:MAG: homoserine kinase [Clostridiales bacterium 38-18]|nr:MAG: homoserine kinase [Clostridiales bacterium 38-18]